MTTRVATAAGAGPGTRFFIPFTKVEENADGSVYVEGVATAEVLDFHGEVVTYEASKRAFEEWSAWAEKVSGGKSLGNIRVMHQPVVAGKAVKWWADEASKSIYLGSQIEDPVQAKMCRSGAYTGYSIGGDNVTREMLPHEGKNVPHVTNYRLAENSIVDKGACPTATFTLVKRADVQEPTMKLIELLKSNLSAVLAIAATMTDEKTIKLGDVVFRSHTSVEGGTESVSFERIEKDAVSAGSDALAALKTFLIEVLGATVETDLWTVGDICEAMRYCYSARMGAQYAVTDEAIAAAAAAGTLKKSDTPDDPPEEETSVTEEIDPKPKAPEPAPAVPPVVPEPEKQAAVDLSPVLDAIAKLAASIESMVKALQEGSLQKASGAHDLTQLVADVAAIKKAIESLPAPPPGRAIQKTLGDGSGTGDANVQALVKIAEDALAKAAEQGTPKSALDTMRLAFTAEVMKRL